MPSPSERNEQIAEAMAKLQDVIEALPAQLRYSLTLGYIDLLRKQLSQLKARMPEGRPDYTLLDVHAQALDAMEMSVKQHRITWEHQRDGS